MKRIVKSTDETMVLNPFGFVGHYAPTGRYFCTDGEKPACNGGTGMNVCGNKLFKTLEGCKAEFPDAVVEVENNPGQEAE